MLRHSNTPVAADRCTPDPSGVSQSRALWTRIFTLPMVYVLIQGPSYRDLDFEEREKVREDMRLGLESHGIRFVEYGWVWDENDRCLLLVGTYEREEDARYWIQALESMGFEVILRTSLPGDEAWEWLING